jgi:uncharacterized membrane protein YvbJ
MKYCTHCGKEILDDAVVCPYCGCPTSAANYNQNNYVPKRPLDLLSVVGFILSFIVAVAGLAVSIVAYNRIKYTDDFTSKGLAKAGIIISSVELCVAFLAVFVTMLLVFGFGTALFFNLT